jgi:hypothetical protein
MKVLSPSEAWARLCFRIELFVHQHLLPLRIWRADMRQILTSFEPKASTVYSRLDSAYIMRRVRKAVRPPVLMRERPCLREGLLAYHFLRKAGYDPALVFGVDAASLHSVKPEAHCWIRLDGKDVFNPPNRDMTIVLRHSASARLAK